MNHCFATVFLLENSTFGTSNKIAELLIETPKPLDDACAPAVDALTELGLLTRTNSKTSPCDCVVREGPPPNGNVAPDWESEDTRIWLLFTPPQPTFKLVRSPMKGNVKGTKSAAPVLRRRRVA